MAHNSAKGTMINWWPRRHVSKFVGAKIILDASLLLFCFPATKLAYFSIWVLYKKIYHCCLLYKSDFHRFYAFVSTVILHSFEICLFYGYFRWAFFTHYACEPYVVTTMKAAVVTFWGSVITSCATLGFILRPAKIGHVDKEHLCKLQTSDSVVAATRKSWSERFI